MAPTLRNHQFLLSGLFVLATVALSACTSRTLDLPKALQVTDVSTGFFDAGIVEGNKNKIVPTISVRLKNIGNQPVNSVQMIAKFNRVGETEEWGSAPYVRAIGPEGLAPGQTGGSVVMKCDRGYTGEQPRAELFTHSQFVDVKVALFAKYQAQNWVKMGDYTIARQLLTR
jgi:hypothetical protein